MFYKFPADMSLSETREVIRRHNESLGVDAFIEADKGEYVIFNYVVSFAGSFPSMTGDPIRDREIGIIRECRGLTFYKDTGKVAVRKFHKFHNVSEREETQVHAIDWSQPHDILLKADGSMITPYLNSKGEWEWHTKMGATDVAKMVLDHIAANPQYVEFAEMCRQMGNTPIFEFCSRKQKIVIDYPEEKLILLAIRNNRTGEYADYASLDFAGDQFNIPVIDLIEGSVTDPLAFLEMVRVLEDQEGYVVRFHNGHMVKVKAEEYLRLHNMIDLLQREKDVLALIMSGSLDDAKALMDEDTTKRVESFAEAVERGIIDTANRLRAYAADAEAAVGQDKKRLALEWVNVERVPQRERGLLFQILSGKSAKDVVSSYVAKNISTGPKVDDIRDFIGGTKWEDYRDHSIEIDDG